MLNVSLLPLVRNGLNSETMEPGIVLCTDHFLFNTASVGGPVNVRVSDSCAVHSRPIF